MKSFAQATCPGRINIIGEHIDYSLYPVLPCALKQAITVTCHSKCGSGLLQCSTSISAAQSFGQINIFERMDDLKIGTVSIAWTDYILCGLYAAIAYNEQTSLMQMRSTIDANDFEVTIESNLPMAVGLSSSSALVVCVAMCFVDLFMVPDLETKKLVEHCIASERLVGTLGGGMDQTICCLARQGHAMHVSFYPHLAFTHVQLPPDVSLIVCNSMVSAEKGTDLKYEFNKRCVECRLGAILLVCSMNCSRDLASLQAVKTLKHAEIIYRHRYAQQLEGQDDISVFAGLCEYANAHLQQSAYSVSEIWTLISAHLDPCPPEGCEHHGDSLGLKLWTMFLSDWPGTRAMFHADNADNHSHSGNQCLRDHSAEVAPSLSASSLSSCVFELRARVQHVWQEASRVDQFVHLCTTYTCTPPSLPPSIATSASTSPSITMHNDDCERTRSAMTQLGALLTASHRSLSSLYHCSCEQLDKLVALCLAEGALGCRLTGAGWGGCVVCVLRQTDTEGFIHRIASSDFYSGVDSSLRPQLIFSSMPECGARILTN